MTPRSTVNSEQLLQQRVDITEEQARARHAQTEVFQKTLIHLEDAMDKKIDKLIERFDSFETKLEWKFAWKWTEKILIFIGSAVWVAIVGAVMAVILKK